MKTTLYRLFNLLVLLLLLSCDGTAPTSNSNEELYDWQSNYTKTERYITMRDGVRLFTTIYSPTDTTQEYPILLKRTPYSCQPYGTDSLSARITHNEKLLKSGYIFVFQDVRGRWMSEGDYENIKPPYSLFDSTKTDELTDTWDTFDWFLDSLSNYNGNAGLYGTSYPGWTTLVGAQSKHPSIKAVIATAPVTNFYFEDFNRNGLLALNYLPVISVFGTPRPNPVDSAWWPNKSKEYGIVNDVKPDYYDFFLERMSLKNFDDILDTTDFFWKDIKSHPTYDAFRKMRDWEQYYNDIECQVMVVGGWNDEQNLYGILNSYKHIAENSPKANARLVMGPWSHGHPTRGDSAYYLGDVFYGYNLSKDFMENTEFPYFEHYLKNKGEAEGLQVRLFDTGINEWTEFEKYPKQDNYLTFYLNDGALQKAYPEIEQMNNFQTYISDPFHPVPFIEGDDFYSMAPKSYFTADQRFASKRPDVLTFTSEQLTGDITVLGEIKALIDFATDHKDADIYVKIIDVYPMDRIPQETDLPDVKMNGYQQLVRAGYIRGRYRESYEVGKPFVPNQKTTVDVPLLDVYHTFKKGHQIMVQIQSSWFPAFDLNPQNYVEDIYKADKEDFAVAMHKVFATSKIDLPIKD